MEVRAVRILKKDGSAFIKVLVDSEQNPISPIKNEQWLKHEDKQYKYGFNFSEEFFKKLREIEVEEVRKERTTISKEELKQMIREILKELKEEEKQEE